jgi:hypothetical protein
VLTGGVVGAKVRPFSPICYRNPDPADTDDRCRAAATLVVPSVIAYERRNDLSWHHDWPLILTGVAGFTVLTSDYSS